MNGDIQYNKRDLADHLGIWLFIEREDGCIYMQYHNKFGCWTVPLEKSEPGETLEEAVVRAGLEELGVSIAEWEVMHEQENEYLREGHAVHVRGYLIRVTDYTGTITNMEPDKHKETGWKTKEFVGSLEDTTDATKALQKYLK